MKNVFKLLPFPFLLFGEGFEIQPVGNLQYRYVEKSKKFSSLGESVYQTKKVDYEDYIIGGTFGAKSSWQNYEASGLLYGVKRLHTKDENELHIEKILYDNDQNGFGFFGELYLQSNFENSSFSIGRQTKKSALVDSNERVTKNSFEGLKYRRTQNDIDFEVFYFNKIAASTISNSVPFNHKYGFLGYGLGYKIDGFTDISTHILNKDLDTLGALQVQLKVGDVKDYLKMENLFVDNFFDIVSFEGQKSFEKISLRGGFVAQKSVGEDYVEKEYDKKLDSKIFQGEIKYKKELLSLVYRISKTDSNTDAVFNGTLFSPFSNKPAWIVGISTAHSTIADTVAQQLMFVNTFYAGKLPLTLASSYLTYAIGEENGLENKSTNTDEFYTHFQAHLSKNLSLTFQYSKVGNIDIVTTNTEVKKAIVEWKF